MPLDRKIERSIRLAYQKGHAGLPHKTVEEVRAYYSQNRFKPVPTHLYQTIQVRQDLNLRLYQHSSEIKPLLIYFRASAFVLGTADDADNSCLMLAEYGDCHVAAIEPRLAPENKFPAQIQDCVESVIYLLHNAQQYNISSHFFAFWGESSGGNLATVISNIINAQYPNLIKLQLLFYPMLDCSNLTDYESKKRYGQGYMMDNDLSEWFIAQYTPTDFNRMNEQFSPLYAQSTRNLPDTFIYAAQYDPMLDEATAYYEKLIKAGNNATMIVFPGMVHGFLRYITSLETPQYAMQLAIQTFKEYSLRT